MDLVVTPYVIVCAITTVIAIVVAVVVRRRQDVPGGKPLFWLMVAVAIWAFAVSFEYATVAIPGKIFWAVVEYIGVTTCPVFFLLVALEYNRMDAWRARSRVIGLFIIPAITWLLALTNGWHHLVWTTFTPSPVGENLVVFDHGVGYWIGLVGYSYLLMLMGTTLILSAVFRFPPAYRPQMAALAVGALVPWLANLIYISGLSPAPGLELTPIALSITGIIYSWGLVRLQLLDLVPVSRESLIESMNEGMLVLDVQGRVVDVNTAAQRMLRPLGLVTPGLEIAGLFLPWPELITHLQSTQDVHEQITLLDKPPTSLELNITSVKNKSGEYTGRLIILRDVTERKLTEDEIRKVNEVLQDKLAKIEELQDNLREQAIRDSLTGLYNRRYLDETLETELARAERNQLPVSVVMLDIDHFKDFNDTCGHKFGDLLLQSLGKTLLENTRPGDFPCRYGGEEFVVILPGAFPEGALTRARQWLAAIEKTGITRNGQFLHTTLSGGVAAYPDHGKTADELLGAADRALYLAKASGRNRVMVN
jgi:diguanylate cyclase (GGDEF)-like protein